jgi:hypothetical protein
MTTITLATIESRPLPRLVPATRWRLHEPGTSIARDPRSLEAIERAHAALVLARLLVLSCLGAGAMVAGAVIGHL